MITLQRAKQMIAPKDSSAIVCSDSTECCTALGTANQRLWLVSETYTGGTYRTTIVELTEFVGGVKSVSIQATSLVVLTTAGIYRFHPVNKTLAKVLHLVLDESKFYYVAGSYLNGVSIYAVADDESVVFSTVRSIDGLPYVETFDPVLVEGANALRPQVDGSGRFMIMGDVLFGISEYGGYLLLPREEIVALAIPPIEELVDIQFGAKQYELVLTNLLPTTQTIKSLVSFREIMS